MKRCKLTTLAERFSLKKVPSQKAQDFLLLGEKDVNLLGNEADTNGVMDSACSSNVSGDKWLDNYLECLSDEYRVMVTVKKGLKWFRFGG